MRLIDAATVLMTIVRILDYSTNCLERFVMTDSGIRLNGMVHMSHRIEESHLKIKFHCLCISSRLPLCLGLPECSYRVPIRYHLIMCIPIVTTRGVS